jgi:hypothetical protein
MLGRLTLLSILIPAAGFFVSPVAAQVATGNIRGTVLDASEAVIPNAIVVLTNISTGFTRSVTCNERGDFDAPSMPLGDYQIAASAGGFQKKIITGITLQVDQTAVFRIVLQPGAVNEVVQVTGTPPVLDSETSSLGQVIENKRVVELPLNGRNPFALGLLSGGATPFYGLTSNLPFMAGGGRMSANDILLDGNDDNMRNFAGAVGRAGVGYIPSVDAVEEFKVKTNNFSAEYGHSAGYTVNATIKSGSNQYHGSLYEFLRNDKLDANNFVSNFSRQPKAEYRQNQFGGAVGGPMRLPFYNGHNRTFFFGDFEETQIRQAAGSTLSDVPPASFRQGNFASAGTPVYDPATRILGPTGVVTDDPFPGNVIPSSRIDPTVQAIQTLMPMPNVGGSESTSRNFLATTPNSLGRSQGDIRIDHQLFHNNNLMGRFSMSSQSQPIQGSYIFSPVTNFFNTRNAVLSDTEIFGPRVVNEFRFGYNRANSSQVANTISQQEAFTAKYGLQSGPVLAFPDINFNYSGESFGQPEFSDFNGATSTLNFENSFEVSDNITIIRHSHTIKTGMDLRRFRFDTIPNYPLNVTYYFGAIFSSNPSLSQSTGLPYADFLLGDPALLSGLGQIDWVRQRDLYYAPFVQDDWKISSRLTLNLGFRWDLYTQPVDAKDVGGVFDPNLISTFGQRGVIRLPGKNGNSRAIVQGHHKNFAPRFGFAWQATRRLVVRGGYGIFYSQREQNRQVTDIANTLTNFQIVTSPSVIRAQTTQPPFHFTSPVTVVSDLDPNFTGYNAQNPIQAQFMTPSIANSRFPSLQQYNLALQYEAAPGLLIQPSFAGARGSHWVQRQELNSIPFSQVLLGKDTQADRPLPYAGQTVAIDQAIVNNWYNAFIMRVEKRFSQGLTFLANYTFSKNLQSGDSGSSQFNQEGSTRPEDPYNIRLEKGLAPTDITHQFVTSALYQLPFGRGKRFLHQRGVVSQVFGGWQVNGILTLRSGFLTDTRVALTPPTFTTTNRPNRVLGQTALVANPGFDQYFNPKAFAIPPTVPDYLGAPIITYGNAPRLALRGPGSRNLDFSVFKEFHPTERAMLQFRAEAFNLSNTPTFTLPNARSIELTVGNAAFGKLVGSQTVGRQVQFGLKLLY